MSWTVPLRYWESHLLDVMFEVLRVRAGQRVSRAQWLMARAQVLLQAAAEDATLSAATRAHAGRALADYHREHQTAQRAVEERRQQPAWETLTR